MQPELRIAGVVAVSLETGMQLRRLALSPGAWGEANVS